MSTTYYYTVNDEIIGEHTLGQSRLDYIPDGLGSVVATIDQTLTVQSTARYKPYGADLATTGTMPMYGWAGRSARYRRTSRPHSDIYAWNRHDSTVEGRWTTVDPIWPLERAFTYVDSRPTTRHDRTGRSVTFSSACPPSVKAMVNEWCRRIATPYSDDLRYRVQDCMANALHAIGKDLSNCGSMTKNRWTCMQNWCAKGRVTCFPGQIPKYIIGGLIQIGYWDGALGLTPGPSDIDNDCMTDPYEEIQLSLQLATDDYPELSDEFPFLNGRGISYVFMHELGHACGIQHQNDGSYPSCNDIWSCCVLSVVTGSGLTGPGTYYQCGNYLKTWKPG